MSIAVPETALATFAIGYGECGWRCFPARQGSKRPIYTGWQASATTEPTALRIAFSDERRNVGVITGEAFDVFDIEAPYVDAVLARLGGQWPSTPRSRTGRGGVHLFTHRVGIAGTRQLSLDGVHVGECKSVGGLVILPPSTTKHQYTWEHAPSGLPLADAPDALRALIVEPTVVLRDDHAAGPVSVQRGAAILAGLVATVRESGKGQRNAVLFWAACRAHEHGLPVDLAARELAAAAAGAGLGVREIRATLRSAADR